MSDANGAETSFLTDGMIVGPAVSAGAAAYAGAGDAAMSKATIEMTAEAARDLLSN